MSLCLLASLTSLLFVMAALFHNSPQAKYMRPHENKTIDVNARRIHPHTPHSEMG